MHLHLKAHSAECALKLMRDSLVFFLSECFLSLFTRACLQRSSVNFGIRACGIQPEGRRLIFNFLLGNVLKMLLI